MRMLILLYTAQKAIPNVSIKFQNPRYSSSWEIFDTDFPMHYIGLRYGKKKKKKKAKKDVWHKFPYPLHWSERWKIEKRRQNKFQHHGSLLHNISSTSTLWRCIQNLKTGSHTVGAEKIVMKILLERKKNGQIKGMISMRMLILSIQYNKSLSVFVPNFKILCACSSSWKVFDGKKKVYTQHTHMQTNIVTKNTKTIYPFILCMPGVKW